MDGVQQRIFDSHTEWAAKFVRRMGCGPVGFDVLQNSALVGLWRAVLRYREKTFSDIEDFRGFAALHVKGQIKNCWRTEHPFNRLGLLYDDLTEENKIEEPEAPRAVIDIEINEELDTILRIHTKKERHLLTEIFIKRKTLAEMDKDRGVSPGSTWHMLKTAFGDSIRVPWNREINNGR